jgi:hypothetical protein
VVPGRYRGLRHVTAEAGLGRTSVKNLQLGIDLERERANRLEMQRKLLEIDQRVRPRTFTSEQREEMTSEARAALMTSAAPFRLVCVLLHTTNTECTSPWNPGCVR